MSDIMGFSQANEGLKPADATAQLASQMQMDGDNNQLPQQMQQQQQQRLQQQQQQQQQQGGQQAQQGMMNAPQPNMGQGPNMMQQPNHAQMALQRNGIVQGMAPGSHTPNQNHMQLPPQGTPNFSSPSVPNMNLPAHMTNGMMNGSPHIGHPGLPGHHGGMQHMQHLQMMQQMGQHGNHTPSPAQTHMAAPPMMPQHSQQGTNSNASVVNSANTSPQVTGKRRRSQIKLELDGMGDEPASQRVKPSPRMGGNKKGK